MNDDDPCYLYRHWDSTGAGLLLYVGITINLRQRRLDHMGESRWWRFVADVTVEQYVDSVAAEQAELHAIEAEQPIFNRRTRGLAGPFRQRQVENFYVADRMGRYSPLGDLALGLTRRRDRGRDGSELSIGVGPPVLDRQPAPLPTLDHGISDTEWEREWGTAS